MMNKAQAVPPSSVPGPVPVPPPAQVTSFPPQSSSFSAQPQPQQQSNNNVGVLVFEQIVEYRFRHSTQGVLFVLFGNGEASFYPLNEQTKGTSPVSAATMLTTEGRSEGVGRKLKTGNFCWYMSSDLTVTFIEGGANAENNKYFAYDAPLSWIPDIHHVYTFSFAFDEEKSAFYPPKKVLLSPNKRLLMMHGALHRDQSCLLVYPMQSIICHLQWRYQILEQGIEDSVFKLIFYDFSFNFVDACFSPDSRSLVVIPTRYPSFIFMISLPLLTWTAVKGRKSNYQNQEPFQKQKLISFEARKAGPIALIGPAKGAFGQPLKMTRIISNSVGIPSYSPTTEDSLNEYFHFITWNEEGFGEYCMWRLQISKDHRVAKFECFPRLVNLRVGDKAWLEDPETPKNFILDVQFSSHPGRIFILLKRNGYSKKTENGIGMQMVKLSTDYPQEKVVDQPDSYWYQVSESDEEKDILCSKWTNTLLLGTSPAAAVIVKGKGLFELVDFRFGSAFQGLYDTFVQEAVNFVQVGRYHRFWVTSSGSLRVTPQTPSSHPEWSELFNGSRADILNMRFLGRRIGYFINEIDKDPNTLELLYARRSQKKGEKGESVTNVNLKVNTGTIDRYNGLHLYRCGLCKRSLLKPLQCSRCRSIAYCSKQCQKADWAMHSPNCIA